MHAVPTARFSGYYTPGTFQQYALAPATYATPIPDALASDLAAPLPCGGVTVYSALKKSRAQTGDWVVIPGSGGGLGHLALQIGSRGMGYRMIGIDVGEKEKLSKECGAEVKPSGPSFAESSFLTLFDCRYLSTSQNSAGTRRDLRSLRQKSRNQPVVPEPLLWSSVRPATLLMGKVSIS